MRFAMIFAVVLGSVAMVPDGAAAQDAQTLADIRQELTVLNVEMTKLKRELATTGTAGGVQLPASVLERVNAMESELARVTSKTEELEFRINRIVDDGTRRIADLEFRLVELEGGDISTLGETTTLGGADQATAPAPTSTPKPTPANSPWVSKTTSSGRRRRSQPVTFVPPQTSLRPSMRPIRGLQ